MRSRDYDMLKPHYVENYSRVSREELKDLRAVIDSAADERPVQAHLAANSRLLTVTVNGGHGRWLLPQVRLGAHYVADFLLAHGDSAGVWWTLVELESPTKPMFTQGGELADRTRHAVDQVQSWRNWLRENGDHARKPRDQSGLGLPGISERSFGMVLIDRRANLADEDQWRRRLVFEQNLVSVHTYDWLLDTIQARIENAPLPSGF